MGAGVGASGAGLPGSGSMALARRPASGNEWSPVTAGSEGAGRGGVRDGGRGVGMGAGAMAVVRQSASASASGGGGVSVQGVGKAKRTAKREELIWGAHFFFTHYFRPALTDAGKVGEALRCEAKMAWHGLRCGCLVGCSFVPLILRLCGCCSCALHSITDRHTGAAHR